MHPVDYFHSLTETQKEAYAKRMSSTLGNIRLHYFSMKGFRKVPRDLTLVRLAEGSEGNVSLEEAIDYFLVQPVYKLAEELKQEQEKKKDQAEASSDSSRSLSTPVSTDNVQLEMAAM